MSDTTPKEYAEQFSGKCGTCKYWHCGSFNVHTCRRRSPRWSGENGFWPVTSETDWCGQHCTAGEIVKHTPPST